MTDIFECAVSTCGTVVSHDNTIVETVTAKMQCSYRGIHGKNGFWAAPVQTAAYLGIFLWTFKAVSLKLKLGRPNQNNIICSTITRLWWLLIRHNAIIAKRIIWNRLNIKPWAKLKMISYLLKIKLDVIIIFVCNRLHFYCHV